MRLGAPVGLLLHSLEEVRGDGGVQVTPEQKEGAGRTQQGSRHTEDGAWEADWSLTVLRAGPGQHRTAVEPPVYPTQGVFPLSAIALASASPPSPPKPLLSLLTALASGKSLSAPGSVSSAGRHPGHLTRGPQLALGLSVPSDPAQEAEAWRHCRVGVPYFFSQKDCLEMSLY